MSTRLGRQDSHLPVTEEFHYSGKWPGKELPVYR